MSLDMDSGGLRVPLSGAVHSGVESPWQSYTRGDLYSEPNKQRHSSRKTHAWISTGFHRFWVVSQGLCNLVSSMANIDSITFDGCWFVKAQIPCALHTSYYIKACTCCWYIVAVMPSIFCRYAVIMMICCASGMQRILRGAKLEQAAKSITSLDMYHCNTLNLDTSATVPRCAALCRAVPRCAALCSTESYCAVLCRTVSYCVVLFPSALRSAALCCAALRRHWPTATGHWTPDHNMPCRAMPCFVHVMSFATLCLRLHVRAHACIQVLTKTCTRLCYAGDM